MDQKQAYETMLTMAVEASERIHKEFTAEFERKAAAGKSIMEDLRDYAAALASAATLMHSVVLLRPMMLNAGFCASSEHEDMQ